MPERISQRDFAQLLDGPAVDREIDRLTQKRGGWLDVAQILSRRINGSRGEAVLFDDRMDESRIIKLRGREENGYGTAGFGCILVRNQRGMIEYGPGSMAQALERERLSWEVLGFGCELEAIIGESAGMLLAQHFIAGTAPTEREIHAWMTSRGWEPLQMRRDVSVTLRDHAWQRDGIGAFDANETNFVRSETDGEVYPIDLIVWPMPGN
jgi:hypothetical protein